MKTNKISNKSTNKSSHTSTTKHASTKTKQASKGAANKPKAKKHAFMDEAKKLVGRLKEDFTSSSSSGKARSGKK